MNNVIFTTAFRHQNVLEARALKLSKQWNIPFHSRKNHTVSFFYSAYNVSNVVVLDYQSNLTWHKKNEGSIKYHPGMAIIRIKRLQSGNNDSMIDIIKPSPNQSILDCTLGLAGDAIVAQFFVNKGQVVGLESEKLLALFTEWGLKKYEIGDIKVKQAMSKIKVVHANHNDYLKSAPSRSFDYIYFDPMFRKSIKSSQTMQLIKNRCYREPIAVESIKQAMRVARKKIILKETSNSNEFERLGFKKIHRPNASFTYGIIDVEV